MEKRIVTLEEIDKLIDKNFKPSNYNKLKIYGIPKSGNMVAIYLKTWFKYPEIEIVYKPEETDVIVDDLIDSGKTYIRYAKYNKPFWCLFDKRKDNDKRWYIFPWEMGEDESKDLDDHCNRIIEHFNGDVNKSVEYLKDYENKK